jgi:hypothetical protein
VFLDVKYIVISDNTNESSVELTIGSVSFSSLADEHVQGQYYQLRNSITHSESAR